MVATDPCPCGSSRVLAECCGPLHAGTAAPDAEALMRSRYSAYVLKDRDYLLMTWHPDTRPESLELEDPPGQRTRWLGLSIRHHRHTGADLAEVEFIARFRVGGAPAARIHERSRFQRLGGRWYYLDGEHH
ncbi:YchJ family protein [Alkalisalibacterium limincola]|uniref:UPF0225 protein FU658_11300 n=1 Tax=Alkalisalibacterium limincola TaxID=2699169 RepID=A0A5C8KN88_9GAMM|nr:YchJ family metal-binding protein [Alkalisalibacterium limincola]TXK60726.1 hypothetical protein FU658_11300 [Alkalisalibacterium limincola]